MDKGHKCMVKIKAYRTAKMNWQIFSLDKEKKSLFDCSTKKMANDCRKSYRNKGIICAYP